MLIEFVQGQLPWRKLKDKVIPSLLLSLPPPFRQPLNQLQTILLSVFSLLFLFENTTSDIACKPIVFYSPISSPTTKQPSPAHIKYQDQIGDMKVKYNTPELVKDLPPQFLTFMKHLKSLQYADRPDYNHLYNLLLDLYHSVGCDDHTPFDWEVGAPLRSPQYPTTPLISTSDQNVEFTRDKAKDAPNQQRAAPEDGVEVGSPNTISPPSHHSHPNNSNHHHNHHNGPNNKHDSRRDSASVIAASTSDEKETGSWEKKSSPQGTAATPTKPDEAHLKVGPPTKSKNPSSSSDLQKGSQPPAASSGNKPKTPRAGGKPDKSQDASSCRCIIM